MLDGLMKQTLIPLVLRLGLAVIFIYHGLEKVTAEGNLAGAAWMRQAPDPLPAVAQMAVAWGELLGGIALLFGFLTRLAAAGIALIMLGAIYTVTGANGFSLLQRGYEYNFAILVMCLALILSGGGTLAVDRWLRLRRRTAPA